MATPAIPRPQFEFALVSVRAKPEDVLASLNSLGRQGFQLAMQKPVVLGELDPPAPASKLDSFEGFILARPIGVEIVGAGILS